MKKRFTFALLFANGYEKDVAGVADTEKAAWKFAWDTLSSDEKDGLVEFDCVDEEEVKLVVSSIPLAFIVKALAEKIAIIPSPNSGNPRFFV